MSVFAGVAVPANAGTEKVVYSFKGGSDGANPQAALLDVNGDLYGTTSAGGTGSCGGCGTVFKITAAGREKVLHAFQGGRDGDDPVAGLIDVKGTLYGTTSSGVAATGPSYMCSGNCGTVFSITPAGTEKVLHVFASGSDGAGPQAGLIDVKGVLYGTTAVGGGANCFASLTCGTVFTITPKGTETVLRTFGTGAYSPYASLINLNGKLYGTTMAGGIGSCNSNFLACGAVYSITPSGSEAVLYNFTGGSDGGVPYASLIEVNGKLYGTSLAGGSTACSSSQGGFGITNVGCGTVFSIELKTGKEKVLYAFNGGSDGAIPVAGLTPVPGVFESTLYGTTSQGGAYNLGTVFAVNPATGMETVVYAFKGGSDGANPQAGLIDVNGTLYGTTANGGTSGLGTVFSITP